MGSFITELSLFFKWFFVSSIQVSILICFIFMIKAVIRERLAVRWHYWLWLLLLARMVMPWGPTSRFSIFTAISYAQKALITEQLSEIATTAGTVYPARDGIPDATTKTVSPQAIQKQDELIRQTPEVVQTPTSRSLLSLEVIDILSLVWLTVASALLSFALACNFRLWRIIKSKRPLTEEKILNLLEDCKVEMGIQTILGIIVTDKVKSPALFGVIRPRLLLPEEMLETLDHEELRYVFLHELAHLKRHDIYLGWMMVILQVLHWFNPLVWLAFHRMRADRELACDGLVLSTAGAAKTQIYGQTLVNLFRRFSGLQYAPGIAGILENKSQLKRRITMIAQFKKGSYRWSLLAVVILAVLGCLFLSNAQGVSQTETKEPEVMAKKFVELLVKGEFSKAVEGFDTTMKKSLPTDKLAETWRTTTGQAGLFKQQLGTRLEKFLSSDIVFVTCEFEKGPMDVKVVYDSDRKVSGLWFLPTPQKVLDEYKGKVEEKPRKTRIIADLSYGNGKSAGKQSIAGSGHSVRFDAPSEDCVVKAVKIYGSRYGYDRPPKEDFHIYLCDENYNVITDFPFPYSHFQKGDKNGKPRGWVTLNIEPTPVPSAFFVSVDFNPERTKGVYVHYDAESTGHSFIAIPGQSLKAFDKGDWMIRAVVETPSEAFESPAREILKIPEFVTVIAEALPVDRIDIGDRNMTKESLKKIFGKPDQEQDKWLDYRQQNGLDFYVSDYLVEIHLNPGFQGRLKNGISMESTLDEIFEAFGEPKRTEETEDLKKNWDEAVLYKRGNGGKISYKNITFWLRNDNISQIAIGKGCIISNEAYDKTQSRTEKNDRLQAENLTAEGWRLWGQRKLLEAEEKFKKAIELDPQAEGAYQGLGWAQLNQGKRPNAEVSFEKCIAINPKNSAALNGLGWIAYGQGKKDQAIAWWKKAVDASNGYATASLSGLTQVYMESKDYDNAIKYYQMWLKVEPDNEQVKVKLQEAQILAGGDAGAAKGFQETMIKKLLKEMHEPTGNDPFAALNELVNIGKPAVESLIDELKKSNNWQVAKALGGIRDYRAIGPLLVKWKETDTSPMNNVIAEALENITSKKFGKDRGKWEQWWDEYKEFYTPEDTIRNFMTAAVKLDADKAMTFVAPDSHDYDDIKEIFENSENPFNIMFRKLDASKSVKIVETKIMNTMCSAVWQVAFKEEFTIEGKIFNPGDTFDLDGNLHKSGDKWLITGI